MPGDDERPLRFEVAVEPRLPVGTWYLAPRDLMDKLLRGETLSLAESRRVGVIVGVDPADI